jgi:hypothetical protein
VCVQVLQQLLHGWPAHRCSCDLKAVQQIQGVCPVHLAPSAFLQQLLQQSLEGSVQTCCALLWAVLGLESVGSHFGEPGVSYV